MTLMKSLARRWRVVVLALVVTLPLGLGVSVATAAADISSGFSSVTSTTNNCTAKPSLKRGARGTCVKELQHQLIVGGFKVGRTGADGVFGANTYKAVVDYQKLFGLKVDGIVGKQTWGHIVARNSNQHFNKLPAGCYNKGLQACFDKSERKTFVLNSGKAVAVFQSSDGGWHYGRRPGQTVDKWWDDSGATRNGEWNRPSTGWIDDLWVSTAWEGGNMYHAQFFNRGIAFHGSDTFDKLGHYVGPYGEIGSAGCIRMSKADAKTFWGIATTGGSNAKAKPMVVRVFS